MAPADAAEGSELGYGNLDTLNLAVESGVRRMDDFTWLKGEVQEVDMLELPVVDLQKLRNASSEELAILLKALAKFCSEWGLFRLLNHGVSDDMLQNLQDQTVRVFSLPSETKNKVPPPPRHEVGFVSGADGHGFDSKLRWWHESFQLYCDPECVDVHTHKLWPDGGGEEFSLTIKKYMRISHELGLEMLHYVSAALNIDSCKFIQQCRESSSCLRLNHYPPCKSPENVMGLFAHSDDDILTILYEDGVGGLQFRKDNTWFSMKPEPNSLLVNIGDILKVWSNNIYCNVVHRVSLTRNKRRVSAALILYPEPESIIEPAAELINSENPAKYKPFVFEEFRASYFSGTELEQTHLSQFELNT